MRIQIEEDMKSRMKKDNQYVKDVMKGKVPLKKSEETLVLTPDVLAKVFSPQRIRLLKAIQKNNIKSIYQLAKNVKRKYEAVHRDIKYLVGVGLIKVKDKENAKIPYLEGKLVICL